MKRLLSLLLLLFIGMAVNAQKIRGTVYEIYNNEKSTIPGANVYWQGTTDGIVTDANGEFELKWNNIGKLVVSFVGYQTKVIEVKKGTKNIEIELVEGEMLDEINVVKRGSTTIVPRGAAIEQVLTGEELCKAACCNLGESFTTNASVDVSYADAVTGAKQIQLLGLTGKYVQMMTENIPNFRGVSSLYGLNYVPGPWMSSISISKGVSSVINGYEAIAGQISTDYKKPQNSEKFFINAYGSSEGMFEFNVNASALINDKWSAGILAHTDFLQNELDHAHTGFLDMPKTIQYNFMPRFNYKSDTWSIQFGGKFLDEKREGGQTDFKESMRDGMTSDITDYKIFDGKRYGINIDTRRYEGFLKLGYLMPQDENTSMAMILNYTNHDQNSKYGAKTYNALQETVYANYIYQSVFANNENHKFSAGASFNYDKYNEEFSDYNPNADTSKGEKIIDDIAKFNRDETSAGAFFQYTGKFSDKFIIMAGLRYDYHNIYGSIFTPRLNLAYMPDEFATIKISAGKGSRASNILAENSYLLASANMMYVNGIRMVNAHEQIDNLDMEEAWNYGILLNKKFFVFGRTLDITMDYYRTDFIKQVMVDSESNKGITNFYNLDGDSYSNCYQAEVKYELFPQFDIVGAFRYNDVQMTYTNLDKSISVKKETPLKSKYKGLVNLSYYTNFKKWQFDFTAQFNGSGRMPAINGVEQEDFDPYTIMNCQITKYWKKWSIYAGCENIADFTQDNPVIGANDPWSADFDASKVWGPIHGRKFYIGIRFALDR